MPKWKVTDHQTGETLVIDSDKEPSDSYIEGEFQKNRSKHPAFPIAGWGPQEAWESLSTPRTEPLPDASVLAEPFVPIPRMEGKTPLGKIGAGLYNVAKTIPEAIESPIGLLSLPIGAAGALGKAAIGGVFGGLAAKSAGEQLGQASVTGDLQQYIEGLGSAAIAPLAAFGGKSRAKPVGETLTDTGTTIPKPEIPITTKEVPSAIPERVTETVPVEAPPGDRGKVGARVPEPEKPAEAQKAKAGETPVQAEVAPVFDIESEGRQMGLTDKQIELAKKEGVTSALGLRRIEKNTRGARTLSPLIEAGAKKFTGKSHADAFKAAVDAYTRNEITDEEYAQAEANFKNDEGHKFLGDNQQVFDRAQGWSEYKRIHGEEPKTPAVKGKLHSEDMTDEQKGFATPTKQPVKQTAKEYLKEVKKIQEEASKLKPEFEIIEPSKDTKLGKNDAGEEIYQRKDGSVYRMRFDSPKKHPNGYPDFGGDLNPVKDIQPEFVGMGGAVEAKPKTPIESLNAEASVKVKAPEGATALRGTDAKGRSSVQMLSSVNKGANPFKDSGIVNVEAGTIGKDKQFKPMEGPISVGPGAQTAGEPKYPAIQQLTDQLNAVKPTGVRETISARQKSADAWSQGKSAWEKTLGKMRAVGQSIYDTARGVRDINDLERKVGELDWAIQQSAGLSSQAKKSMRQQIRNKTTRDAAAIWIDAGGDENLIRQYAAQLPKNTRPEIRRAVELAGNLPPESRQFAEQLRQFFGIRRDEAVAAGVFDEGLQDYYTHIWNKPENMPDSLRAAISNGQVSSYFQFAQRRKVPTFLEGIMQGKVPKLDPAEVVPYYNFLLDRAIASRKFIEQASKVTASDGRPALLPTGTASVVGEGEGGALIIDPKGRQADGGDYRLVDHPALRKWKWAGVDENGNPVMYKSDLAVHPEFYERIARMMDRGRLTPTQWGKTALRLSTEVKAFKLGLISAFHTVHVGSHALFHWTNPFKAGEIDWTSPFTRFAVEKGHLKIGPSPQEIAIASEGILGPGLVHKIPFIGPLSKAYSEWTFGSFIPRLKLKTFENAYNRALWMRDKLGAYKGLTDEQIAARIGDSVNNAYGELNQLFLGKFGRDPRFQRILRGIFLAPDFGEARLRFVEKAFTKFGHEERLALATMFATFYLAARVGNWLSHGDPETDDIKNAFSVKVGKNWFSMRSVIGDVLHAWKDSGRFMYNRLNPIYSRTAADWLFGKDVSGRKLTATEKAVTRPLEQLIPIQLGSLTRDDQKLWQSFITSMGLQARSDKPAADIRQIYKEWAINNTDPKIRDKAERQEQEYFAPSAYNPLRNALRDGDLVKARQEYDKLLVTHKPNDILRTIRPFTVDQQTYIRKATPVLHGLSAKENQAFLKSLTPEQRKLYDEAQKERDEIYQAFRQMLQLK